MGLGGYCEAADGHPYHGPYHDHEYGFPLTDESELFGRLMLEVNQAGLSWLTILKKQETFRTAYEGWNVDRVAAYGEDEKARLLADRGIIRNKLKIDAAKPSHPAGRHSHLPVAVWEGHDRDLIGDVPDRGCPGRPAAVHRRRASRRDT